MTSRIARAPHPIDSDEPLILVIKRARELSEQIRELKAQQNDAKLLLAQTMRDNDAQELTLGGVPVARLTTFDRQTIKVSELLARFPYAAILVRSTPVVRVELP